MAGTESLVLVLDDDRSHLKAVEGLLAGHGYRVQAHAGPDELLRAGMPVVPACLLLDNRLGNCMTGVEVYAEMRRRGWDVPTVFLTAHWSLGSAVKAMQTGADGYLAKPCDPAELLAAVGLALRHARARHQDRLHRQEVTFRASKLTARECEVVRLMVKGLINKEIADRLGIALITVKVHRGRAMRKFHAGNPAELARLATLGGLIG